MTMNLSSTGLNEGGVMWKCDSMWIVLVSISTLKYDVTEGVGVNCRSAEVLSVRAVGSCTTSAPLALPLSDTCIYRYIYSNIHRARVLLQKFCTLGPVSKSITAGF